MDETWKQSLAEHRSSRRQQLIESALALFLERDLANVTMTDIVARAGISRVTLYKYFKSIHEIAFEVQMKVIREMNVLLREWMLAGRTGADKLDLFFEGALWFYDTHPHSLRFMGLFDHYYRNTYPNAQLEEAYRTFLNGEGKLPVPLAEGITDGSLHYEGDTQLLVSTIANVFLSVGQRMAARGHLIGPEHSIPPRAVLVQTLQIVQSFLRR
ncbi:TetR/AcrR family transcriptional regulator [Ectobacillus ponti]|uniref:TetR/AcrR family transcriptional regulator n=1 Tax=Ectobacillus ponti TaxID=2961894 RepID=A0AA42BQL4_9BACI|nr:TetR/AcrR family transcriptional regulator [Ectobacillus ponti]MCP8969521.1 TetR/AcrR family transcriptional regulator [Ectobacillus ponti]